MGARKIDPTDKGAVLFYEVEFYMFSNFSSFAVEYDGETYPTAEHAYQAAKFYPIKYEIREMIRKARSAHDAKETAHAFAEEMRDDWKSVKLQIMEEIIWEKLCQHPFIQQRLAETEMRAIIENSRKDAFWGWGSNKSGKNHLGRIWMNVRERMKKEQGEAQFFDNTPFHGTKP